MAVGVGLDDAQDLRVGDEAALDHLAEAGDQLGTRQGRDQLEVAEHTGRFMERADEVLARTRVDAGLAAHGGVDHAEQRRRDVDDPDAAQPGGRDEAADVSRGAATEGHHHVRAREAGLVPAAPSSSRPSQ